MLTNIKYIALCKHNTYFMSLERSCTKTIQNLIIILASPFSGVFLCMLSVYLLFTLLFTLRSYSHLCVSISLVSLGFFCFLCILTVAHFCVRQVLYVGISVLDLLFRMLTAYCLFCILLCTPSSL